jgi:hypothetical protein
MCKNKIGLEIKILDGRQNKITITVHNVESKNKNRCPVAKTHEKIFPGVVVYLTSIDLQRANITIKK